VGKTYRKTKTERQKEKNHKWKAFRVKRKIIRELEDYEKEEEMSELSDEDIETHS
tara:strand:- start:5 stop:169 length:165 start_codon:yes stop_codon:yes gene_type:complete